MSKNGKNGESSKAEWAGFSNIRLETQHKKEIKRIAKDATVDDVWSWILTELDSGYKVSLSPDDEHMAVVATLTGHDVSCPNAGYSMSQRHQDPLVALLALRFAHVEIAQRQNWDEAQSDPWSADW